MCVDGCSRRDLGPWEGERNGWEEMGRSVGIASRPVHLSNENESSFMRWRAQTALGLAATTAQGHSPLRNQNADLTAVLIMGHPWGEHGFPDVQIEEKYEKPLANILRMRMPEWHTELGSVLLSER